MQRDLQPDEAIGLAAEWLARDPDHERAGIVPTLRTRFGITTLEAIEAIRKAQHLRRARAM